MYSNLDIVNLALRKAGFSSRINPASNDMIEDAWEDLKLMVAELSTIFPVLGGSFNPSGLDEPSGLDDSWVNGVAYELVKRIQPDYETALGEQFLTAAYAARESLNIAMLNAGDLMRRTDMPVGSGWKQPVDLNFYKNGEWCGPSDGGYGGSFPSPTPPPFQCSCDIIPLSHLKLLGDEALFGASEKQYSITGFYSGSTVGGGLFVFNPDGNKASHNGVTVYAPEAIQAWAGTQADITTLLNWTGVGSGVWVRIGLQGFVTPEMAGALHGEDIALSLLAADSYCQHSGLTLTGGSSGGVLSSAVTLKAPFIELGNYELTINTSLIDATAVTYQGVTNDLKVSANVKMRFEGQRDLRPSGIIAFKLRATPTADSLFCIYGNNCNTLCNVDGNVERSEIHIKGNFVDTLLLESGDSPDTNRYYVSGGQYKRAYHKTSSTTSHVTFNCQSQEYDAGVYAIEISGNRGTTLSGELRVITHGAVKSGGFTRQSIDFLTFDNFHVESAIGSVPAVDIDNCNLLAGRFSLSAAGANCQPVTLRDVQSADVSFNMLDCLHVGYQIIFGSQSLSKACAGKYTVIDRGSPAGAKAALFDRVGAIDVYFDGSSLPIDVSSTVSSDVINISVEKGYISSNVAITTNGVRVNGHVRGLFLTPAILAYSSPFRGMNCMNVNTNGLCFYDGTSWQRYTSSALV